MAINTFLLEEFYEKYEFCAPYLLSQSDCQSTSIAKLLSLEPGAESEFLATWLGYTESRGSLQLREAIASLYESIEPDAVLVHSGAEEAIHNFMQVFLEKGDHVIHMAPAYQSLFDIAVALGCEISAWKLEQIDSGWFLDIETLTKLIKPSTKLIVINTPHNPTGYSLSTAQLDEIASIANERGIFVFCDQVYKGLEWSGEADPWFCDICDHSLSLGVMSKAYGLPGLRIGWIATQDRKLYDKLLKYKYYTTICNSAPSEYLATIALRHHNTILRNNLDLIKDNLAFAERFFNKHQDIILNNRPQAGPIAFHKYLGPNSVEWFCEELLEAQGVLLLPGYVYGTDGYFRMGYGRSDFKEGLMRLDAYLS